jgi:ATP-dependent Lon protease
MSEPESLAAIPLLPIKNAVLFPYLLMPLSVGRPNSIAAVERAMAAEEKSIVIVAQRDPSADDPRLKDLFTVGTRGVIKKLGRRPDGAVEIVVQGVERVAIVKVEDLSGALHARV